MEMDEELLLKYMDQLYRIAFFMTSNSHDAEDAVQETCIRYFMRERGFHDEEHVRAWLIRVCINQCRNQIRRAKRHPLIEYDGKEKVFGNDAEVLEIMDAVHRLPDRLKDTVILYAVGGYSVRETAEILRISEEAVKKRLQRGRKILKKVLGE